MQTRIPIPIAIFGTSSTKLMVGVGVTRKKEEGDAQEWALFICGLVIRLPRKLRFGQ